LTKEFNKNISHIIKFEDIERNDIIIIMKISNTKRKFTLKVFGN